jgi:hypothetical protein
LSHAPRPLCFSFVFRNGLMLLQMQRTKILLPFPVVGITGMSHHAWIFVFSLQNKLCECYLKTYEIFSTKIHLQ